MDEIPISLYQEVLGYQGFLVISVPPTPSAPKQVTPIWPVLGWQGARILGPLTFLCPQPPLHAGQTQLQARFLPVGGLWPTPSEPLSSLGHHDTRDVLRRD